MPESIQPLLVGELTRLRDHMETVDGKVDTMAVQIAVLDTHVTKMTKDGSETTIKLEKIDAKVEELRNLKFQVLGGMGVISFLLFIAAEALRVWFH